MVRCLMFVACVAFAVNVLAQDTRAPAEPAGMQSLFNGKDLTGWGYRPTTEADQASAKRWQASDPHAASWPFVTETTWFDGRTESPDGRFKVVNGRLVVTTPPEARKTSSPPLNVCLVLDRSKSMQGEKMDVLKAAAN